MEKIFRSINNEKLYLNISSYSNNERLYIGVIDKFGNYFEDITVNIPKINIDDKNQVFLSDFISAESKNILLDKGIITRTIDMVKYNLGTYSLVEIDLEKLKEYDKDSVEEFIDDSKEQVCFSQYNESEIVELLNANKELVFVDIGIDKIIVKYEDIADVIVGINDRFGSTDLKIYEFDNHFSEPIVTTFGPFLNKCDPTVREDIIDRLVELQLEKDVPKGLKVINKDMLEDAKISLKKDELER